MSIPMVLRNAGNRDGQRNMSQGCVVLKRTRAFSFQVTSVHNSTAATPVHRLCD